MCACVHACVCVAEGSAPSDGRHVKREGNRLNTPMYVPYDCHVHEMHVQCSCVCLQVSGKWSEDESGMDAGSQVPAASSPP